MIFTSVHGDMHGAHGLFRKGWPYEESIRVPLLVRGLPGAAGRPVGVAVFVHLTDERFVVLHLGVAPGLDAAARNSTILLKLMHEIRRLARRTHGVNHIELVYTQGPANQAANRLHGIFAPG